jgi:hypothetical protein
MTLPPEALRKVSKIVVKTAIAAIAHHRLDNLDILPMGFVRILPAS